MRKGHCLIVCLGLFIWSFSGCKQNTVEEVSENYRKLKYSEKQLELFLDSIGHLPISQWEQQARHQSDSIFYGQKQLSTKLSKEDHQKMLRAAKTGWIEEKLAQKYKWDYDKAMVHEGKLDISFFPLDSNKEEPDKFAFCFGPPARNWACDVYFFNKNLCLSKHHIYHRYGLELEHYRDADGKTVVYYKENFESGTGVWWFDFYFYKYSGETLIPVLNVLQNGNASIMPAYSSRWLESTVLKTSPLTIKMTYYFNLGDKTLEEQQIINDSTFVTYAWDEKSQAFEGNYNDVKLSKNQILSYNLASDPLFFLHSNYRVLKTCLQGKDQPKREAVLFYLDDLKAGLSD